MAGNEDTSYVPKSPDFSSFLAAQSPPHPSSFPPPDNHAQQTAHQLHHPPPGSYHFPASSAAYTHAPAPAQAPQMNHAHSPQFQPQSGTPSFSAPAQFQPAALGTHDGGASDFGNTFQQHHHQPHLQPHHYQYQHSQPRSQPPQLYPPQEAYAGPPHHPAHPQQAHFSQPYANPPPNSYLPNSYPYPAGPGGTITAAPAESQHIDQSGKMPPRRAAQQAPPPPLIDPSPVRTKFPTARIKRIMQADEEVGKVAQQTPIAVGKALELFMISMVTKSADVAKGKGQKRITANMLKQVVERDDQFDFLREIVGKVEANDDKKHSRVKSETESEEEVIPEPKRRVRAARKKKET